MNRRRIFIALAIAIPLALFFAARNAASWRPVAIGPVIKGDAPGHAFGVTATEREVVARFIEARPTLFDLKTGAKQVWPGGVTAQNNALWRLSDAGAPRLLVRDATGTLAYALPAQAHQEAREMDVEAFVVSLSEGELTLITPDHFYRWNRHSRALQSEFELDVFYLTGSPYALTRDGQTIVALNTKEIVRMAARAAHTPAIISLTGLEPHFFQGISPFGAYAWYDDRSNGAPDKRRVIVDARTGRALWKFDVEPTADTLIFSPDEKTIAILRDSPPVWELRDIATGRIVRTLARIDAAQFGGFSPDSRTFYSITPYSVLYRQRAR